MARGRWKAGRRVNAKDRLVLEALSPGDGDYFMYLRAIANEIDMPHREVRIRSRRLTRNGLARLEHLFDDGTGLTAGSTYVTTQAGRLALQGAPSLA